MSAPIVDLLRDLIRLPSVNPMGRAADGPHFLEHRVTDYLESFFRDLGVPFVRQPVAESRENIVAVYEPTGGSDFSLLWEVHQDTVPVEGMTIEPFDGELRDGKVWGRGACDVKGGMAAMLTAFARLVREQPAGSATVTLACTVDEEHTFLGVQELARLGIKADGAVVAEPTGLDIVDAHKGVARWLVRTEGRACHSSDPAQGISAIYRMGRVLVAIEEYAADLLRSPGDPRLGSPTLSVGRINGGVSVNTVPDACVIEVDRRLIPGETAEQARRHLENFLNALPTIDFPVICDSLWLECPALAADGSEGITRRLGQAINQVRGSHSVHGVKFGTDASTIAGAGVPAVVFGPGHIAQAHTRDEFIEVDQLEQAAEILFALAATDFGSYPNPQ